MARIVTINGVGEIDLDKIARLLPGRKGWDILSLTTQGRYIKAIVDSWPVLESYDINTPLRLGHFFGQGLVETGWLKYTEEGFNYSADALIATFRLYRRNPELARQHARRPELIANTVYGGRADLGNTEPGDGWKFRGRGFIQLTGRYNYTKYGEASGVDLVNDPDIIKRDLRKSVEVAAAFWKTNGLNAYADQNDAVKVSRGVNRGNPNDTAPANHEDLRILWTETALSVTQSPQNVAPEPQPAAPSLKPLSVGSRGERVRELQADLETLGIATGGADGIFGQGTRRAVTAFQQENGLPVTGIADQATIEAVDRAADDPTRTRAGALDRNTESLFGPPVS
ncbi:MAG: peptidoglycan-binding protein [Acidobacteria bacterium]|jgi:putative chitinase|nr:peptidoglycan-binding protein [Acidobacteriota bacterium]